ncbi:DUF2125 domain-containing protein [Tianweitania sediminis]|uniref:DUF2125 domain-containing protein n=1 Tax=Tianweitania sediminis TaxID=1502156 RepID=A0A8J7RLY5_9HYPH|nr:DUF2125 domain-containing protein [Tianweitania sediminis]MBP0438174.1 DUF2125 domain-containing protein [Tianweitania sediminis]
MTSSDQPGSPILRRVIVLAVIILVVVCAYVAGWYYLAEQMETAVNRSLRDIRRAGGQADCVEQDVRGFPFRIGLFCERVTYANPAGDIRVEAGAFRSAAQIYQPRTVIGEVEGPLQADLPGLVPLSADWELMHASARLAEPMPSALSVEGRDVAVREGSDGAQLFTSENMQLHLRTNEGDVDLAARFAGLRLTALGATGETPPFQAVANLTVFDGVALAVSPEAISLGYKTEIRTMTLSFGPDAEISLSGPLAVDPSGLIDAKLTLTARRPDAIARVLTALFPDQRREIEMASSGLMMLGNAPSLPLTISKGRASIAFITLGDIPPLRP